MQTGARENLRQFLQDSLKERGDQQALADADSLFVSGRLDSFCMTQLILYLEETFGIDFANVDFDLDRIDSLDAIMALVGTQSAA